MKQAVRNGLAQAPCPPAHRHLHRRLRAHPVGPRSARSLSIKLAF